MKMARSAVSLLCVMVLAQGLGGPVGGPCRADAPELLPDLYIVPYELSFSVDGVATQAAVKGRLVSISALVANAGPGNITSAMMSFYCGTALLGITPLRTNISGRPDIGMASFIWDTSFTEPGNHTILVELNSSGGDANMTNNSAEAVFMVVPKPPTLEIKMDSPLMTAEVTETLPGRVSFNGTVRLAGNDAFQLAIELEASVDQGWSCSCSPKTIVASDDKTHLFSVSVIVPEKTYAAQPGTLSVTAIASGSGYGLAATARAIMTVKPYYRVMIESDVPYREISPGSQAFFSFKVWNYGNAVDSFEIDISNLKDLVNDRWTIALSVTLVPMVPVAEYRVVHLTAQSPRQYTLWESKLTIINVRISSSGARDRSIVIEQTYPMYAYEKGSYPPNYNFGTFGLTIAILAALVIAVGWRWRLKKKRKAAAGNPGELENLGAGGPVHR